MKCFAVADGCSETLPRLSAAGGVPVNSDLLVSWVEGTRGSIVRAVKPGSGS
jgi:hypothetical protein